MTVSRLAPIPTRRVVVDEQHDPVALGKELADEVNRRFLEHIRNRGAPTSTNTNRASSLGDPCLRRGVLRRTAGEQARPIDDVGLAIFNTGNLLEGPIRRMVEDLGFEIDRSQRSFPPNDHLVSGHIDGVIRHRRMNACYILEIKTLNGTTWGQLNSYKDIAEHAKSWVSKYAAQGIIYAALNEIYRWGDDAPILGVLYVLFNKWTGQLKAIPAPLDQDAWKFAESLLDRADSINEHVKAGTLPDFIDDPEECRTCPFVGRACHPPIDMKGAELTVCDDVDVIAALETMEDNKEASVQYKEAEEYLFDKEKGGRLRGAELCIVPFRDGSGHWLIRGKVTKSTSYKVPEEIRNRYKHEDPEGGYRKSIERVVTRKEE